MSYLDANQDFESIPRPAMFPARSRQTTLNQVPIVEMCWPIVPDTRYSLRTEAGASQSFQQKSV